MPLGRGASAALAQDTEMGSELEALGVRARSQVCPRTVKRSHPCLCPIPLRAPYRAAGGGSVPITPAMVSAGIASGSPCPFSYVG